MVIAYMIGCEFLYKEYEIDYSHFDYILWYHHHVQIFRKHVFESPSNSLFFKIVINSLSLTQRLVVAATRVNLSSLLSSKNAQKYAGVNRSTQVSAGVGRSR
jgi:hypothetical protein